MIDKLWFICLSPFIIMGSIASKYSMTRQVYDENHLFEYYADELPSDHECSDLSNKRKWLHKYKKRN